MDANGDRIVLLSRHNFNKANPRLRSACHPKADITLRILGGKDESTRCTDPMLQEENVSSSSGRHTRIIIYLTQTELQQLYWHPCACRNPDPFAYTLATPDCNCYRLNTQLSLSMPITPCLGCLYLFADLIPSSNSPVLFLVKAIQDSSIDHIQL